MLTVSGYSHGCLETAIREEDKVEERELPPIPGKTWVYPSQYQVSFPVTHRC